jgi:hypothetical protein
VGIGLIRGWTHLAEGRFSLTGRGRYQRSVFLSCGLGMSFPSLESCRTNVPTCVAEKPAVPRTTNETHGFVGLSAILALSLAVLGTRCFSPHRKGR